MSLFKKKKAPKTITQSPAFRKPTNVELYCPVPDCPYVNLTLCPDFEQPDGCRVFVPNGLPTPDHSSDPAD